MILADTSIWVDHLRAGEPGLVSLLNDNQVLTHPMVIGELACGNLPNRDTVLGLLGALPAIHVATHEEVLFFIEQRQVMGRGIGYIDAHLLAAAKLAPVGPALDKGPAAHGSGSRAGLCLRVAAGTVASTRPPVPRGAWTRLPSLCRPWMTRHVIPFRFDYAVN